MKFILSKIVKNCEIKCLHIDFLKFDIAFSNYCLKWPFEIGRKWCIHSTFAENEAQMGSCKRIIAGELVAVTTGSYGFRVSLRNYWVYQ